MSDPRGEAILQKDGRTIAGMFDDVAPRYDLLNRVLSLGIDRAWRRELAASLEGVRGPVLDLCTGTGDAILETARSREDLRFVGIDFSPEMIERGAKKVTRAGLDGRVGFALGDAMRLPVRDACAGAATIAFGIRNVQRPEVALAEIRRSLAVGGRLVVLEFAVPTRRPVRDAYLFYFRHVLPRIGGAVSGVGRAYRYLPASVLRFPEGQEFVKMLRAAGFGRVDARKLSLGIACVYVATREA